MSRVGKRELKIPSNVEVNITENNIVTVNGPLGTNQKQFPKDYLITIEENVLKVKTNLTSKQGRSMYGTVNSLINGMIIGVSEGFKKELEIIGVGYNVKQNDSVLTFSLGYSHKIDMIVPSGLKAEVPKQTSLVITGYDKQAVGLFAAQIKKLRKPEPYGGKGIRYKDEQIIRKAGKANKK